MKKQFVSIGIIVLLVFVGLTGCNQVSNTLESEKSRFVGTWQNNSLAYDFFSDGTFTISNSQRGTWDLTDGNFVMLYSDSDVSYPYHYTFSDNDRTLTLIYTRIYVTLVLTRQ